jgi:hypothetical protein
MSGRKSKKLSAAGARFPLRDLLTVLEARIQDVDGTSKNTSPAEIVTTGPSTAENLNRSQSVSLRDMIV